MAEDMVVRVEFDALTDEERQRWAEVTREIFDRPMTIHHTYKSRWIEPEAPGATKPQNLDNE